MFKIADFYRQTTDNPLKSDSDAMSKSCELSASCKIAVHRSSLAKSRKEVSYASANCRFWHLIAAAEPAGGFFFLDEQKIFVG